jgi:hypothetical protein
MHVLALWRRENIFAHAKNENSNFFALPNRKGSLK